MGTMNPMQALYDLAYQAYLEKENKQTTEIRQDVFEAEKETTEQDE